MTVYTIVPRTANRLEEFERLSQGASSPASPDIVGTDERRSKSTTEGEKRGAKRIELTAAQKRLIQAHNDNPGLTYAELGRQHGMSPKVVQGLIHLCRQRKE